jgi:hypothetical protein
MCVVVTFEISGVEIQRRIWPIWLVDTRRRFCGVASAGIVISQLNKMKFAKTPGSLPKNVNFGIKASTVRQFLTSSGLPTKWSDKSKPMSIKHLAKIAKRQTVMVVCHQ